jgi:hypothetical protein
VTEAECAPSDAVVLCLTFFRLFRNKYSQPPPPPPPARSKKISLVVLGVDDGTLPLASRHVAVEQDVDLAVGAALHLWDVEVGQGQAEECRACPNIAAFSAEVSTLCEEFCQRSVGIRAAENKENLPLR